MEKQDFMHACREGGKRVDAALAALYQDYGQALAREAWRGLKNAEAARDLLQETLIKAWRACGGFRAESELYPWLLSILRRSLIDMLRRQRPMEALEDTQGRVSPEAEAAWAQCREDLAAGPAQQLQQRQSEAVFRRCAERFAAEQPQAAQVLRWIAEDELSPAQLAELLGRSPGATREYISQCRKKARHYFLAWYELVGAPSREQAA